MPDDATHPTLLTDVGENPRENERGLAQYRQLRDARSAARAEERRQEGAEAGGRVLKVAAEWSDVARLCQDLLTDIGRDIEVAVWLIEAETRLDAFAGLARSAGIMADMIEAHGTALHPQPEDALDRPFDIIAALNGVGREGTLIQPLHLVSLAPEGQFGAHGLWNVTDGAASADVAALLAGAGSAEIEARLFDIAQARAAIARCDTLLTDLLGPEAPPFAKITDILDTSAATIRNLAGDLLIAATEPDMDETPAAQTAAPGSDTPPAFGTITSREDAFAQMLRIAAYFRRTEPHSPIADALETLVRRGRMDFSALLAELIPDDHARSAVLTSAGIGPRSGPNDGGGG
ncbi:type VI secretion system ImpA family N-terminal domain-containing protein [Gymnodinialimonas sp. 2305UL16-5]|uniref:type VI secretion system protein TssA n=1 Tax=Gymnodinialimonas mytili TaxID=3126503 RepID=UPI00309B957D